jgi:pyridoxine 5-phosphate synthase
VPERRQELTTEGGLDVAGNLKKIRRVIGTLSGSGIEVSLFIDPDKLQLDAARRAGANMVELHTGRYAEAKSPKEKKKYFQEIKKAAEYGSKIGLAIFAGHGLDYNNSLKIAKIKEIEELNIGYSIILRAVIVGLDRAVRQMKLLVN